MTARRVEIGLSQYHVCRLAVDESLGARPSQHSISIGDVQMPAGVSDGRGWVGKASGAGKVRIAMREIDLPQFAMWRRWRLAECHS